MTRILGRTLQITILLGTLVSGCVTAPSHLELGIQEGFESFVPAKIAVLPCQIFLSERIVSNAPLTNAKPKELGEVCLSYDKFVLSGFKDQPYMKGYSPRAVEKLLVRANKKDIIGGLYDFWAPPGPPCSDCKSLRESYLKTIQIDPNWKVWLGTLSQATRHTDALLLPIVTFGHEQRSFDRGVSLASRQLSVALILVDSTEGKLIWMGERTATVPYRRLESSSQGQELEYPGWNIVAKRLFAEQLWREFPGRIAN